MLDATRIIYKDNLINANKILSMNEVVDKVNEYNNLKKKTPASPELVVKELFQLVEERKLFYILHDKKLCFSYRRYF